MLCWRFRGSVIPQAPADFPTSLLGQNDVPTSRWQGQVVIVMEFMRHVVRVRRVLYLNQTGACEQKRGAWIGGGQPTGSAASEDLHSRTLRCVTDSG